MSQNKEIQIVTAFFSIGRQDWNGFKRSDDLYFSYFKGWAKLKNRIVVYTDKEELKERVLSFRASIGQEERTTVVLIPDIYEIEPDLYRRMQAVSSNHIHSLSRLLPRNPEVWNASYDYVMLLKMWCCADAVEKGLADGMVAWMDFGFNHGGSAIDSDSDFNFLWEYDFPEKINLFLIQDLDDRPVFDIIASMDTYVMGSLIVAPARLWERFWLLARENMDVLTRVSFIDDDQSIILMCLREHPELFTTYKSSWFLPLKQFGGDHLKLKVSSYRPRFNFFRRCLHKMKHLWVCFQYAFRICAHMSRIRVH